MHQLLTIIVRTVSLEKEDIIQRCLLYKTPGTDYNAISCSIFKYNKTFSPNIEINLCIFVINVIAQWR